MFSFLKKYGPVGAVAVVVSLIAFVGADIVWQKYLFTSATQPSIKVASEVKGAAGSLIVIEPESASGGVAWYSVDGQPFLRHGNKGIVVVYPAPGRYKLLAWSAYKNNPTEAAVINVVIGDPPPAPLPTPPSGPLSTPLGKAVLQAYRSDPTLDKDKKKSLLASLYKQSATVLAKDESIKTVSDLHDTLHAAIQAGMGDDLKLTRQAISGIANIQLPNKVGAPLDDATRTKAADFFTQVSLVLEAL